jgi:hypothetical protein
MYDSLGQAHATVQALPPSVVVRFIALKVQM